MAFGLMTVIPVLICFYLITVKFFSIDIFIGAHSGYVFLIIIIALLGLVYGRGVVLRVVRKLHETSEVLEWLVSEETVLNKKLKAEIVERRKAQEKLSMAQDQLIQVAKMESIGRLAAGTAHEVKNPLAMLMMGVDYLQTTIKDKDQKTEYMLTQMNGAVRKADSVILGLLDFASSTRLDIKPEGLNSTLEQSLSLVKHELDKNNVRLIRDFQPDNPPVRIDRRRMQQVFVNLFTNAIHAMPDGGVLTVRAHVDELTEWGGLTGRRAVDYFKKGEKVAVIEIEDNGTGIPKESIDRIFDPFFTSKRDRGGTGLGLSIVENLVDMHRGIITIRNKDEGGVVAKVLLKLKEN